LISASSKMVYRESIDNYSGNKTIELPNSLSSGIYMVSLQTDLGIASFKVIK